VPKTVRGAAAMVALRDCGSSMSGSAVDLVGAHHHTALTTPRTRALQSVATHAAPAGWNVEVVVGAGLHTGDLISASHCVGRARRGHPVAWTLRLLGDTPSEAVTLAHEAPPDTLLMSSDAWYVGVEERRSA